MTKYILIPIILLLTGCYNDKMIEEMQEHCKEVEGELSFGVSISPFGWSDIILMCEKKGYKE